MNDIPEPGRCCTRCKQTKPAQAFDRHSQLGKRRNQCRVCRWTLRTKRKGLGRVVSAPVKVQVSIPINYPTWLGPVSPGNLAWTP